MTGPPIGGPVTGSEPIYRLGDGPRGRYPKGEPLINRDQRGGECHTR